MILLTTVGVLAVLVVLAVAFIVIPLIDKPEGAHHTTRRTPEPMMHPSLLVHGPLDLHHEPGVTLEDAATVAWLRGMRGLRHPGWTAFALRARIAMLAAITSVRPDGPGRESEAFGREATAPATTEPGSVWPLDTERPWADDTGTFTAIAAGWS